MTRTYEAHGFAGCVSRSRSRQTGRLVGVYQGDQAGIEDDPATPWVTVCEDHGSCVCHTTLALARAFAAFPLEWCEDCRTETGCPDHWHCHPGLAAHVCDAPDRSAPCPTCEGPPAS